MCRCLGDGIGLFGLCKPKGKEAVLDCATDPSYTCTPSASSSCTDVTTNQHGNLNDSEHETKRVAIAYHPLRLPPPGTPPLHPLTAGFLRFLRAMSEKPHVGESCVSSALPRAVSLPNHCSTWKSVILGSQCSNVSGKASIPMIHKRSRSSA